MAANNELELTRPARDLFQRDTSLGRAGRLISRPIGPPWSEILIWADMEVID